MLFFQCVLEPDEVTFSLILRVKQVPEAWLPSNSLQAPVQCALWPGVATTYNLKSLVQA